jgi:hypothetical protein
VRIALLPAASAELEDAILFYENEQSGLGYRMWLEVDEHMEWIARNPLVPRLRDGGYRRVNLKIFPYYIAYIVRSDGIVAVAIANARRKPEYWIERIKTEPLP